MYFINLQLEKKYVPQGLKRQLDVNDTYVYIIANAYKHFIFSGTGIRTLIEIYVYNEYCKDLMDTEYIYKQCKILGIQDYENKAREMAYKLFDVPTKDFFKSIERRV